MRAAINTINNTIPKKAFKQQKVKTKKAWKSRTSTNILLAWRKLFEISVSGSLKIRSMKKHSLQIARK